MAFFVSRNESSDRLLVQNAGSDVYEVALDFCSTYSNAYFRVSLGLQHYLVLLRGFGEDAVPRSASFIASLNGVAFGRHRQYNGA